MYCLRSRWLLIAGLLTSPVRAEGPIPEVLQHPGGVSALTYSSTGRWLASGGLDQTVCLLNPTSGETVHRFQGHEGRILSLAFSPNEQLLASGSRDTTIFLWDLATGKARGKLEGHERSVLALAFSPDGRHLASGSYDGTFRLWDVATHRCVLTVEAHVDAVSCLSFQPDGKRVATGGYDRLMRLWELDLPRQRARQSEVITQRGTQELIGLGYLSGGRILATASPAKVALWDLVNGQPAGALHNGDVIRGVGVAPDGRAVALGGSESALTLFEAGTGRRVIELAVWRPGQPEPISRRPLGEFRAVAVSPGGLLVAGGDQHGRIYRWDVAAELRGKQQPSPLDRARLDRLFDELSEMESARGYQALATLLQQPDLALSYLRMRITPVPLMQRERIQLLLAELDQPRFARREKAQLELATLAESAEPLLRQALLVPRSLEARRRIEQLLRPLDSSALTATRLQADRALLLAEQIASKEADIFRKELASGLPGAWLTQQAQRSLRQRPPRH